jgi:hypothetical protein
MKEYSRICPICNKEINYTCYKSFHSAKSRNSGCKSCRTTVANKSSKRNNSKENNINWKGYKKISFNWFSRYFLRNKNTTKRIGNITIEQVYDLWEKQNRKCDLSGLDIGFYDDDSSHTCSIDRIDSLLEYTLDNIQLVHKNVNRMKNVYTQNYFINMCKLIAEKNV